MAKYLTKANYNAEGARGLLKDGGSGRRAAVQKLVTAMGGKLEGFYFGYGDCDAYVIIDLPDHISALAISLAVNASGLVTASTVPLITPEEMDMATKKVPAYQAPGA
jgi:uncharacterized protein with GYD domain